MSSSSAKSRRAAGADVIISNHDQFDDAHRKIAAIAAYPSDPQTRRHTCGRDGWIPRRRSALGGNRIGQAGHELMIPVTDGAVRRHANGADI